jgi:hypothetical protein
VDVAELVPEVAMRLRCAVRELEKLRARGRLEQLLVRRVGLVPAGQQAVDGA